LDAPPVVESHRKEGVGMKQISTLAAIALALALITGCVSVPKRNPLPEHLADVARVPGGEHARHWGDVPPPYADQ
jgi:hypothetical protein